MRTRLTQDQLEAFQEEAREEDVVMQKLEATVASMGLSEKTALLMIARELAEPGNLYEVVWNGPRRTLGFGE